MNNKKTIAQTYIQQSMVTKGKGNDGEYISYIGELWYTKIEQIET